MSFPSMIMHKRFYSIFIIICLFLSFYFQLVHAQEIPNIKETTSSSFLWNVDNPYQLFGQKEVSSYAANVRVSEGSIYLQIFQNGILTLVETLITDGKSAVAQINHQPLITDRPLTIFDDTSSREKSQNLQNILLGKNDFLEKIELSKDDFKEIISQVALGKVREIVEQFIEMCKNSRLILEGREITLAEIRAQIEGNKVINFLSNKIDRQVLEDIRSKLEAGIERHFTLGPFDEIDILGLANVLLERVGSNIKNKDALMANLKELKKILAELKQQFEEVAQAIEEKREALGINIERSVTLNRDGPRLANERDINFGERENSSSEEEGDEGESRIDRDDDNDRDLARDGDRILGDQERDFVRDDDRILGDQERNFVRDDDRILGDQERDVGREGDRILGDQERDVGGDRILGDQERDVGREGDRRGR